MIQGVPYDAEIEYLESTGTQWIDTGIFPNQTTTSFALDISFSGTFKASSQMSSSQNSAVLQARDATDNRYVFNFGGQANQSKDLFTWFRGNTANSNNYTNAVIGGVARQTISYSAGSFSAGSTSWTTPYGSETIDEPIVLLGTVLPESTGIAPKAFASYDAMIYGLKIWQSGVLVRDFIPVRVGTEGFLYDRVSGKLFGNNGTGSFVLGQDIAIPIKSIRFSGEKKYDAEVEYLESDGTTYVDTGLSMPVDGTMDYEFMMLDRVVNHAVYQPFGRTTPELTFRCADSYGSSTQAYTQFGVQGKWLTKGVTRFAWHSFTVTPTNMLVDGASSTVHNGITSSTNTIWCGKCRGSNASVLPTRFRLFQIKDSNGVITHQMKPVRVGNKGYLYDKITDQLVGSGNIKVGPDVVQSKFWLPMAGKIMRGGQ